MTNHHANEVDTNAANENLRRPDAVGNVEIPQTNITGGTYVRIRINFWFLCDISQTTFAMDRPTELPANFDHDYIA